MRQAGGDSVSSAEHRRLAAELGEAQRQLANLRLELQAAAEKLEVYRWGGWVCGLVGGGGVVAGCGVGHGMCCCGRWLVDLLCGAVYKECLRLCARLGMWVTWGVTPPALQTASCGH